MERAIYSTLILLLCCHLSPALTQNPQEGLKLLNEASQRYARAKVYRIEAVEERKSTAKLSRDWQKTITTASEGLGNRFRYEVSSADGSSIRVSDGKTEWIYHVEDKAFVQHPVSATGPSISQTPLFLDLVEFHAIKQRETLATFADKYQYAERLADDNLSLLGIPMPCFVVKLKSQDLKKPLRPGFSFEKTVWIEKADMTIRKIVTQEHSSRMTAPNIFQEIETAESFPVVELDGQISNDAFTFTPPQTAAAVEKLPSPFSLVNVDLTGKPAPSVNFKSTSGRNISLESLRGRPVLIDFWATWCLPCLASMPQIAELYRQTKDKGLVFLSVDEDENPKTATDFLAKRAESWPNFHDSGEIGKAFQKSGLPYTILIDAQGKIVFSKTGYSDASLSELREAISKLGADFLPVRQPTSNSKE